jgi:hypothetical protein
MVKKFFFLFVFLISMFLTSGCTIAKGTGGAVAGAVGGAAAGGSEGFQDDVNCVNKADAWVKKNLW